jgi:SAM-dependent methyltransferase
MAFLRKARHPTSRSFDQPKEYSPVHPFDLEFGVETSGLIFPEDLASGKAKDLYNAGYFGVAPSAFRQILNRLQLQFGQYTFIDLGSGKGRALLLASEYPFRAIVGLELSPALHTIAQDNIARYRSRAQECHDLRAIEGDATEFSFPDGPLVVYLWNPFESVVFNRVLDNLEACRAREHREIYVVYIQPDLEHLFETRPFWERLWRAEFPLSEEDYAAHAFPPRFEVCSAYRAVSFP